MHKMTVIAVLVLASLAVPTSAQACGVCAFGWRPVRVQPIAAPRTADIAIHLAVALARQKVEWTCAMPAQLQKLASRLLWGGESSSEKR